MLPNACLMGLKPTNFDQISGNPSIARPILQRFRLCRGCARQIDFLVYRESSACQLGEYHNSHWIPSGKICSPRWC
ncbi:Hypothetical predicted protein [Octopus vulgaris]|uniref:Uncharacterized protein n=1 Tax=Octopus vulgaris TaxID=6645 RepID=A0AA36AJR2_OCTVU|nr:Hypothetical predicted protein [Octopus vulgaris]